MLLSPFFFASAMRSEQPPATSCVRQHAPSPLPAWITLLKWMRRWGGLSSKRGLSNYMTRLLASSCRIDWFHQPNGWWNEQQHVPRMSLCSISWEKAGNGFHSFLVTSRWICGRADSSFCTRWSCVCSYSRCSRCKKKKWFQSLNPPFRLREKSLLLLDEDRSKMLMRMARG